MSPDVDAAPDRRWWPAPAKLNLFLHVTGRRADGFHDIQTLFQLLDWGDEVLVESTDDGAIERWEADYGVAAEDDLAVRAARLLKSASGAKAGARLAVRKNVPIAAGLGGGSSDAATVLLVLNRLWDCGFSVIELAALGLELGADVPLFVHGRSALATGLGEHLEPVSLGARYYLLFFSDLAVSTGDIYADPKLRRDSGVIGEAEALQGGGRNDFEAVVLSRYPSLADQMAELKVFGAARLTGTGSAMFLPMESRGAAADAAEKLKCRYNVRAVGGVDVSPLHRELGRRLKNGNPAGGEHGNGRDRFGT